MSGNECIFADCWNRMENTSRGCWTASTLSGVNWPAARGHHMAGSKRHRCPECGEPFEVVEPDGARCKRGHLTARDDQGRLMIQDIPTAPQSGTPAEGTNVPRGG